MSNPLVLIEQTGPTTHVILNRPEKRNALHGEMMQALSGALQKLRDDSTTRVILLRGAGGIFSSGVDHALLVDLFQKSQEIPFRHLHHDLQDVFHQIERMEKPVIAVLSRACAGMALELAMACDFRIATEDCVLGLPEVAFGLVPDVGGTTRLVRTVGLQPARRMVLTGKLMLAAKALSIGLIDECHPSEAAALKSAQALAEHLAGLPKAGVGMAKRLVLTSDSIDATSSFQLEGIVQSVLLTQPDLMDNFPSALAFIRQEFSQPSG